MSYGTGPADVPFHRFGSGSRPLVVLPGVMDALGWNTPSRVSRELLARYYFSGFSGYDVWVASRPPGLASEGAGEMAERYAQFLQHVGRAHVVGFTLGGAIAAHLAARQPDLVDRLVLVACGTGLAEAGRTIVGRWRALARAERWSALHVDYARHVYTGWYRHLVTGLYRLCGPLLPRPVVGSDVVRSCEALLRYDGAVLEEVTVPGLVVADTRGPLFPEADQRAAARQLPDGYVATLEGSHAVYEQSRRAFADVVRRFLAGEQLSGRVS